MRIEWLNRKNSSRIIVFFNGWGMDGQVVRHLKTDSDVLMFYDYRNLTVRVFPALESYRRVEVAAWSMGVWAATQVLPRMNIRPDRLVALNGTACPVDDHYGIPVRIYELTEKGMNEKGREKFMRRMLEGEEERERWGNYSPERSLPEVCEELCLIRQQSTGVKDVLKWDKVYISDKDVIFPVANQQKWWQGRCGKIEKLRGGHFPFYQFSNWEEIVGGHCEAAVKQSICR